MRTYGSIKGGRDLFERLTKFLCQEGGSGMSTAMTTPEQKGLESHEGYELKITRVFDAPRDLVWKAWTDPAMQMQWMGPRVLSLPNSRCRKLP